MKGTLQLPPQSLHWLALQGDLELCDMVQFAQRALERRNRAPKAVVEKAIGKGAAQRMASTFFDLGRAWARGIEGANPSYSDRPTPTVGAALRAAEVLLNRAPTEIRRRARRVLTCAPASRDGHFQAAMSALAISEALEAPNSRAALTRATLHDVAGDTAKGIQELAEFGRKCIHPALTSVAWVNLESAAIRCGRLDLALYVSSEMKVAAQTSPIPCLVAHRLNQIALSALLENERNLGRFLESLLDSIVLESRLGHEAASTVYRVRAELLTLRKKNVSRLIGIIDHQLGRIGL